MVVFAVGSIAQRFLLSEQHKIAVWSQWTIHAWSRTLQIGNMGARYSNREDIVHILMYRMAEIRLAH